jgi:hypothetical protein
MKRYTALVLGTALFLLASALAAQPKGKASNAGAATHQDTAAAAQRKPQPDGDQAKKGVEQLRIRQGQEVGEIAKVLRNQLRAVTRFNRIESDVWLGLALLTLATSTLIAAGVLWLGWRQRKSLAALEERMLGRLGKLQQEILSTGGGPSPSLTTQSPSPGTREVTAGELPAVIESKVAGEEISRHRLGDSERTATTEAPPLIPPGIRHPDVARLLAKLRQNSRQLAERFADPELRERFRGELDAPVGARLDRLQIISEQGEEQLRQRWLGPDLVTTLDALARFYSEAVEEERHGPGTGLARELRGWLYDSFGPACRNEGWFAIDPIDPYVTKFDPRVHHAVAGRDVDGAEGRIIAIKAIGRRDPQNGAVVNKAEVIVGR